MQAVYRFLSLLAVCAWALVIQPAHAQSILRDAETEALLHKMSRPIFLAAGLTPESVQIYLIGDKTLNAGAARQNMFINSGMIMELDDVNQLLGVIAHETGHIAGAHSSRIAEGATPATGMMLLSMLLGAAAIAAGAGDAGAGLILGGQSMAQRSFLAYSREQESRADAAAVQYLETAGISAKGMIETFEKFRDQELLNRVSQDPYVRSHPLSTQRVQRLRAKIETLEHFDAPPDPEIQAHYERIRAKLAGYVYHPRVTLQQYPPSDTSIKARYARVYAYNKQLDWDKAMAEADSLLETEPGNPYFHEIKGQILFENGHIDEALPHLRTAYRLGNDQPLLGTLLGQALVAKDSRETDQEAHEILTRVTRQDRNNPFAWFNLAICNTRLGNEGRASLASAERAMIYRNYREAVYHAKLATDSLKQGTPEWIRAQDILLVAQPEIDDQQQDRRRRPGFRQSSSFN